MTGEETSPEAASRSKRRPRRRLGRRAEARRRFLRSVLLGGGLLLLYPLDFLPPVRRLRSRLRPPGALSDARFLGACIKCGQCVQVCPVDAVVLADLRDGLGSGVPYIDPRTQACDFSCDALSCVLACPTGALSHDLKVKEEVRMGLARVARPDACLARQGKGFTGRARGRGFRGKLRYEEIDRWHPLPIGEHEYSREICDLCVLECPIGESALRLERVAGGLKRGAWTPVVGEGCVGCGACEMICPQEPSCIVVDPRAEWSPA